MPLFSKRKKSAAPTVRELERRVKDLAEQLELTRAELDTVRRALRGAVSKVAVVRFNPFKEIGGNQSFSAALLDEDRNGLILTSYYGQDASRVYAKPVSKGASEFSLSKEEEQALKQAVRQKE